MVMQNRIHIIGRKNSGKTSLILKMIKELQSRGLKVGTIKHTSHRHDPEPEGKDSRLHRETGANPAAILSGDLVGLYRKKKENEDVYKSLETEFSICDLVLVEGDHSANARKIEVWRKESDEDLIARETVGVEVVISDDNIPDLPSGVIQLGTDQVVELIHYIQGMMR
jgi:molybdopterin-guanine dinucleotide biosynthesis protein B